MENVIIILVGFIALEHFSFLILEMFLWSKPLGRKIFALSKEQAEQTKTLAANQGLYNGFLVAGLLWGLFYPSATVNMEIIVFFLLCIVVAGIYGGISVKKTIFYVQALPAAVTLLLILLSH